MCITDTIEDPLLEAITSFAYESLLTDRPAAVMIVSDWTLFTSQSIHLIYLNLSQKVGEKPHNPIPKIVCCKWPGLWRDFMGTYQRPIIDHVTCNGPTVDLYI